MNCRDAVEVVVGATQRGSGLRLFLDERKSRFFCADQPSCAEC